MGIVQIHNVQDVQQLTFVLMKSLNLNVKNGMRIYLDTIMFQNIFGKSDLVLVFDVHKLLLRSLIIHIKLQLADLRKICDPVRTDMICYPVCQKLDVYKRQIKKVSARI